MRGGQGEYIGILRIQVAVEIQRILKLGSYRAIYLGYIY